MTYKSILVHIDGTPASVRRVQVAARLAADHGAHLSGIAIVPPLELPQRLRSHPGVTALLGEEFAKSLAAGNALAKSFPAQARAAGARSADARLAQDEASTALVAAARGADLVVLGQPDDDDVGALGGHFVERALVESGRPVLVVPRKGAIKAVGRNILVAWKDASGSARAVADARPLLAKAASITVLTVRGAGDGAASAEEALEYLRRHGAKAQAVAVKAEDAGAAILSQAKKQGADLVVMGAYASHRLAEMILGGATRAVLQKSTTCVLMSH